VRRYREPVFVAFLIAVLASLMVHLPVYGVLGKVADHFRELEELARKNAELTPVEVDFEVPDDMRVPDSPAVPEPDEPKPKAAEKKPKEAAQAEAVPAEVAKAEEQQSTTPQKPPDRQAIQQRSQDPDVEPPPDTQYVAQENNRVEEETMARIRNYVRDDEEQSLGPQHEPASEAEQEGNAQTEELADARDKEGSDARSPTEEEAQRERPDEAIDADPIKAERVAAEAPTGKPDQTRGEQVKTPEASETITITDESGTFVVRKPSQPVPGGGTGVTGRGPGGQLTWSQYEAAVGSDELREHRNARIEERKSTQRGVSREKSWNEFRAAIENFTPNVKPGSQTALNAAASPFANYITAIHRRIHREFADRFLKSLPVFSGSPYSDPALMTELEIVLNQNGSVHRVGVARSSGLLPFDFGAFNSVLRAQPFPSAPSAILSGDGRVYMHWGFYRNERQCGTFNAEPYILPHPPGAPARPKGLTDGPDWDTVVPSDAKPTWRTDDGSKDSDDDGGEKERPAPKKSPPAQPKQKEEAPRVPPPPPGAVLG
jgi:hypothetical protein